MNEYFQIFNKDLDQLYVNMSNGVVTWTLPNKVDIQSIKYISHYSESNGKYYYENLSTKAVTWTLPANIYAVAKTNISAIQKMNRSQCVAFLHSEYNELFSHNQSEQLDEYLAHLEATGDPNTFKGFIPRNSVLSTSGRDSERDSLGYNQFPLPDNSGMFRLSNMQPINRRQSNESYISEDSSDADFEGNRRPFQSNKARANVNNSVTSLATSVDDELDEDSDTADDANQVGFVDDGENDPIQDLTDLKLSTLDRLVDYSGKSVLSIQSIKDAYVKRGTLMKQAMKSRRNWRKRHFVLTEYCLLYYENNFTTKSKGEYPITSETRVESLGSLTNQTDYSYCFHVFHSYGQGGDLVLAAKTDQLRQEWIQTIQMIIYRSKSHLRGQVTKRSNSMLSSNKNRYFILNHNILTMHMNETQLSICEGVFTINMTTKIDIPSSNQSNKGAKRIILTNTNPINSEITRWDLQFNAIADFENWKNSFNNCVLNSMKSETNRLMGTSNISSDGIKPMPLKETNPNLSDNNSNEPIKMFSLGHDWEDDEDEDTSNDAVNKLPSRDIVSSMKQRVDSSDDDYDEEGEGDEDIVHGQTTATIKPFQTKQTGINKLFRKTNESPSEILSPPMKVRLFDTVDEDYQDDNLHQSPTSPRSIQDNDDDEDEELRYSSESSSAPKNIVPFMAKKQGLESKPVLMRGPKPPIPSNEVKTTMNAIQISALRRSKKGDEKLKFTPDSLIGDSDACEDDVNDLIPSSPPPPPPTLPKPATSQLKTIPTKQGNRGSRSLFSPHSKRSLSATSKIALKSAVAGLKHVENDQNNDVPNNPIASPPPPPPPPPPRSIFQNSNPTSKYLTTLKPDKVLTVSVNGSLSETKGSEPLPSPSPLSSNAFNPVIKKPLSPFIMNTTAVYEANASGNRNNSFSLQTLFLDESRRLIERAYSESSPKNSLRSPSASNQSSPRGYKTKDDLSTTSMEQEINPSLPTTPKTIKSTKSTQTDDSQEFYQESHKNTYALLLAERESILQHIEQQKLEEQRIHLSIELKEKQSIETIKQMQEQSMKEIEQERKKYEDYKKRTDYTLEVQLKQLEIARNGIERERQEIERLSSYRMKELLTMSRSLQEKYQQVLEEKYELANQRFRVDILIRQLTMINQELYQQQYQQRLHNYYQMMKPSSLRSSSKPYIEGKRGSLSLGVTDKKGGPESDHETIRNKKQAIKQQISTMKDTNNLSGRSQRQSLTLSYATDSLMHNRDSMVVTESLKKDSQGKKSITGKDSPLSMNQSYGNPPTVSIDLKSFVNTNTNKNRTSSYDENKTKSTTEGPRIQFTDKTSNPSKLFDSQVSDENEDDEEEIEMDANYQEWISQQMKLNQSNNQNFKLSMTESTEKETITMTEDSLVPSRPPAPPSRPPPPPRVDGNTSSTIHVKGPHPPRSTHVMSPIVTR